MKFAFGAMPPVEFQWQIGKTIETLDLVCEIEEAIDYLQEVLLGLKDGSLVAEEGIDVHDVLCRRKNL